MDSQRSVTAKILSRRKGTNCRGATDHNHHSDTRHSIVNSFVKPSVNAFTRKYTSNSRIRWRGGNSFATHQTSVTVSHAGFRTWAAYQKAFGLSKHIYRASANFPSIERSLVDQIRRSSRSVCAKLAEVYGVRAYPKHYRSKLAIAVSENYETQVWLDFALDAKYITPEVYQSMCALAEEVGKLLTYMQADHPRFATWKVLYRRKPSTGASPLPRSLYPPFSLSNPSCTTLATNPPEASKILPRVKPRAPLALGLSILYSSHSSTRKGR